MQIQLNKIKNYVVAHKVTSIVVLLVVLFVGHYVYGKITSTAGDTRYITSKVQKGTLIASVTGTGQVSVSNSIDLKPKVSGDISSVNIVAGEKVWQGEVLFSLDAKDAQKAVRDAETNLEAAKLDLATAEVQSTNTDQNQKTAVQNAYTNLLNSTITAIPDDITSTVIPPTISGTYTKNIEGQISIAVHQAGSGQYFNMTSQQGLVADSSGTVSTITAQPIGDTGLYIKFSTSQITQPNWTITIPNKMAAAYQANLIAYQNALQTAQQNNTESQTSILNIEAKQLAVKQKENALLDAEQALSDYSILAPFAGTIASVPVQNGDPVSSGTVLATLVTQKQLAEISLNEVDVAKIKLGQKATLTFDAVPDLTLTGVVSEIDTVGTVSSGVVTYNVKISLDTGDDRIKPGMSVSAAIITDVKQNVLMMPNSAVKSSNSGSYVEMFDAPLVAPTDGLPGSISKIAPNKIPVEVGLSNDAQTEITSGIKEGDEIVTRTILPTAAKATAPSIFGGTGGARVGGGAPRGN